MTNSSNSDKNGNNKQGNRKKWLALTAVGVALLLIPRRSSYQHPQRPSVDKDDSIDH